MSIKERKKTSLSTTFWHSFSKKSDQWLFRGFFSSLHTHTKRATKHFNSFPGEKISLFSSLHRWEIFSCLPLFLSHSLRWLLTWEYRKKPLCIMSYNSFPPVSISIVNIYYYFPLWDFCYYYYLVWISTDRDETREFKCV